MAAKDRFASYHPAINFTFFLGAMILGMVLMHPAYLACSAGLSFLYYFTVKRKEAFAFLRGMAGLFLTLSVLNPVFSPYGETVLFTYFGGRPYTREALLYGMALAAMVVTFLCWFASYNAVMTSDKFLFLFGKLIPSVALILTMVLRLIPNYQKKAAQINGARKGIGKSVDTALLRQSRPAKDDTGNGRISKDTEMRKEQILHGMTILSALTSWALEGGIAMADSMKSRGYGSGKRTSFSLYRFEARDKWLLAVMVVLLLLVLICTGKGGAYVNYLPVYEAADGGNFFEAAGTGAYFLFLLIPSAVNIMEELRWHSLRSKI